jgi:histidyl-tRNA synthetase
MKVGDLVKWWSGQENADRNPLEPPAQHGIVLEFSQTGHDTLSALVLFDDAEMAWITTTALEVISESR